MTRGRLISKYECFVWKHCVCIYPHILVEWHGGMTSETMPVKSLYSLFAVTWFVKHRSREKMAAIFQMTITNAFSWMKMHTFRLRFHWSLFPRVQLTIFQHWFRWWVGSNQETRHYLNQWWSDYRPIYAPRDLNFVMYTTNTNTSARINLNIRMFRRKPVCI